MSIVFLTVNVCEPLVWLVCSTNNQIKSIMNYYCIDYCLRNEDTMIYSHLPVNYLVTTDIDEANKWFDLAVKRAERGYENKLISVKDVPLDYMCNLREAVFENNEPAYVKGRFIISLKCYTFNPMSED